MSEENRVMMLTPAGPAAIAVVRIAGPGVQRFLADRFSRPPAPLRCVHGELRDGGGAVIDDPVVVLHENGQMADVNLHGGPWVVSSVVQLLRESGFQLIEAAAGEAAIDLLDGQTTFEREMVAHLPLARTEQGVRMLLSQPAAWRHFIARRPDEREVQRVLSDHTLWRLLHPPRVAIVGPPNVGKSTLANQLFAQERSITADLPGTTRDWVGEIANLDGLPVLLVDTPGVRETADPIERAAIERSGQAIGGADLVVLVLDASDAAQEQLRRQFRNALVVRNKLDLTGEQSSEEDCDVGTVATTGAGVDELRRALRTRLGCDDLTSDLPRWWTQRQREALSESLQAGSAALRKILDALRS